MENLNMNTVINFKLKNGNREKLVLSDIYREDLHGTEEEFYSYIQTWIQTGRATVIDERPDEEKIADKIAKELMTVEKGKSIAQDRIDRASFNQGSHGFYKKVGFPAKTLLDAQEMHQMLMRNFNLKAQQLGVEMTNGAILVTITNCPVKTYASIERAYGVKRATEFVTNTVNKTADTAVNTADMAVNTLAVPVAKTAIGASAKIAKSLVGCLAKVGGIAVSEVTKNTKQCVEEIKNDGYIAEASGEVMDGIHSIRRTIGSKTTGSFGGVIIE